MAVPEFIRELRGHIGHAPLWLHGATAVVVDAGSVLLVRRADDGRWTPVTGIIDPGEQPAVAAVREVLEETGVVVEATRLARVRSTEVHAHANGDLAQYLDLTFACRYVGGEAHVADEESSDVRWFDLGAMPEVDAEHRARIAAAVEGGPAADFVR